MNARQNFYSSVFEVINSYKRKNTPDSQSNLFDDPIVKYGLFSAALLLSVITGFAFIYPRYMVFRTPVQRVIALQPVTAVADNVFADTDSDTYELRLTPSADTYVSAQTPQRTYGDSESLVISDSPERNAVLAFRIPDVSRISSATLELPAITADSGSVDVFVVKDYIVNETETDYSSLIDVDAELLRSQVSTTDTMTVDVTSYVTADAPLTIMIKANEGSVSYPSRESTSSQVPTLIVQ